jgi:hypothetical protein
LKHVFSIFSILDLMIGLWIGLLEAERLIIFSPEWVTVDGV